MNQRKSSPQCARRSKPNDVTGEESPEHNEGHEGVAPPPLTRPDGVPDNTPWKVIAHNKTIAKCWDQLCANTPANARNCFLWLSQHAMTPKPRRCYALKGKQHAGCWAYEIGAGDRVYYKPNKETRIAKVFYAGPHPPSIPIPPTNI